MKAQIVRAIVPGEKRESYLSAWREWAGTLYAMGIQAELLESGVRPGEFYEISRFEDGNEAALADDRLVRAAAQLEAAAATRDGSLDLFVPVVPPAG